MAAQNILDGTGMDLETQLQQFSLDLVIPHARILTRDADNQRLRIAFHSWPSTAMRVLERPFPADELAVPFQQRVRLDEEQCFA